MKKKTALLGVIGVGLGAVAIGLGLGWIEVAAEWLVEHAFGLFGVEAPPAADQKMTARDWWIVVAVVGALLGAVWLVTASERWRAARTRRALKRTFRADQLLGDAYATKDGQYAIVGVRVRQDVWGPTHKLFHEKTFGTTASLSEPEDEYRFIIASIKGGGLVPQPADQYSAPSSHIDIVLTLGGMSRAWWVMWKRIHWFFSEVKIPWLTTSVTGLCVFFLAAIEAPVGERMKTYFYDTFYPWMKSGGALPPPPWPLAFLALEAEVWTAPGAKLEFVDRLRRRSHRSIPARIKDFLMVFSIAGFRSMKYARPIADD